MKRLIQLSHPDHGRKIAEVVDDQTCIILENTPSTYDLAREVIDQKKSFQEEITARHTSETLDYTAIYEGTSPWCLLPAFDHPHEEARCLVSGTGLTHKASALNRQNMHQSKEEMTDSMKMFQMGLDGGSPASGKIGTSPEWFYKGQGNILKAHRESLQLPNFADDGGEEPEIAGCYLIDAEGSPWRIGFAIANEFSDHAFEKKNYLYLASSKLRQLALGPELLIDLQFYDITGSVKIERSSETLWEKKIHTGNQNMCHSLANMEHHHFKFPEHRRPCDVHIHSFGADAFSFGDNIKLQHGDIMHIEWHGLGRPLRNPLEVEPGNETLASVNPLT